MRKPVQIALIVGFVVVAALAALFFARYQRTAGELASARAAEDQIADRYSRTVAAIAEIQDSLNAISMGAEDLQLVPEGLQAERGLATPTGEEALDRIAVLRTGIEQSRERIRRLESSIEQSGVRITGLEKVIGNLKRDLAAREAQVALLEGTVDSLNTQVAGLSTAVRVTRDSLQTRGVQLEMSRQMLATVYYAVGSKDDLEKAGVVETKGGVLGLGKTLVPTPEPSLAAFNVLDTDQESVIRTGAKKARVVSAQPTSSYELRLVDGAMELHILNPSEFRKVKHVVIVTG